MGDPGSLWWCSGLVHLGLQHDILLRFSQKCQNHIFLARCWVLLKTEKNLAGFSLGILKHASGTPCLAQFGVPEGKICVQVSEYDESS